MEVTVYCVKDRKKQIYQITKIPREINHGVFSCNKSV